MPRAAPSFFTRESFSSLPEMTMTRAPAKVAICSANNDTPPVPWISTVCPGRRRPQLNQRSPLCEAGDGQRARFDVTQRGRCGDDPVLGERDVLGENAR